MMRIGDDPVVPSGSSACTGVLTRWTTADKADRRTFNHIGHAPPITRAANYRSSLGPALLRSFMILGTMLLLAGVIGSAPAFAHDGTGVKRGFLSGVMHPLAGVDHLLAMVAVGLWGAFLGRPLIVALPVIFPMFMAVGGLLGIVGVPVPPVEIGIALSVILLGAAIGAAYKAPVWLACALVGLFGLFHGYAHGQELPAASDPVAYGLGFVVATGALHVAGIGIGSFNHSPVGRGATRTLGVGIALAGFYFLFAALGR